MKLRAGGSTQGHLIMLKHMISLTSGGKIRKPAVVVRRVSYRILSWGGEQDGSRMIVARKSTLTHT